MRIVVASTAATTLSGALAGCDDAEDPGPVQTPEDVARVFPLGLASGDPTPESVVLWTCIAPADASAAVPVAYEVASDEGFTDIVATGELVVGPETDHTLRMKVTGLSAYTHYWYRFAAEGISGPTGRTKTAPAADADVPVRFAMASCQDFNGRYYHAWQVLAETEADLDFVLFLGDYIYETAGDARFQDEGGRQVTLVDGLSISETGRAALTLADYRGLYRQYKADPKLQQVHALYPFVAIWDDHEFADDCWQDHATHFNEAEGDEQDTGRRTAANQAWFEYMPADLERNAQAQFPNDLRIYRRLRFGRHADLVLTDLRSYRDDHVVPEGPANFNLGKLEPNSSLGARQFVLKSGFDPLEAESGVTMLGTPQKQWLIDELKGSTATWKLWASEVMLTQMVADLTRFESLPEMFRDTFYITLDQWDGYRTERAEVLTALSGVENLVTLVGDIHANYASELHVDFDAPGEQPVAVEFVCPGISSKALQPITLQTLQGNETLDSLGLTDIAREFDREIYMANPHIRYTNNQANGYVRIDLSAEAVQATWVNVVGVEAEAFGGEITRTVWRTAAGSNRLTEG